MREFKDSVTGKDDDDNKHIDSADAKPEPVAAEKSEATPAGGQGS
jgi:hypothetical protein